jgi:hypothetical protein
MSLEQAIHEQWAAEAALNSLVPAARVFTGMAVGEVVRPYVVLAERQSHAELRASGGGAVDRVQLAFHVFAADLDEAKAIAAAVAEHFDRSSFARDEGAVLAMRMHAASEHMHDDGVWEMTATYAALVETTT